MNEAGRSFGEGSAFNHTAKLAEKRDRTISLVKGRERLVLYGHDRRVIGDSLNGE